MVGYDLEKKVFIIADFFDMSKYSFDELEVAIKNTLCLEPEGVFNTFHYLKDGKGYPYRKEHFLHEVNDYLHSNYTRNALHLNTANYTERRENLHFGLSYYDAFIESIKRKI